MAHVQETPVWEDGVYQLELHDLVKGGPDGVSNVQPRQLANRTLWLKEQLAQAQTDINMVTSGAGGSNVITPGSADIDASVTNQDMIVMNDTGIYVPAIADSYDSKFHGVYDSESGSVVSSGVAFTDYTAFSPGIDVYLSDIDAGKLTAQKTDVLVGSHLKDGIILLGSSGSQVTDINDPSIPSANWASATSDQTLTAGNRTWVDTSGGPVNITLPANPNSGDAVLIADAEGTFVNNNVTVLRNGERIMSLNEDMLLNVNYAVITLVYVGVSAGWRLA